MSASASAPLDLAAMQPRRSMAEYFSTLAAYAEANADVAPSVPSFPAPQVLTDPDDPPVWPKWDQPVPASTFPTTGSDVYGCGGHLNHFEAHVANLFGKHAGMFVVTGSMALLIALKIHASGGRNAIFACHPKGHLVAHQDRAFESLLGFSCLTMGHPSRSLTAADVELACGKHWKQPSCVVLELPDRELGGATMTWNDLVAVREYTRAKGIRLHLDGARVWEIQAHYRRSFQEIAGQFDSVYVSFYKGLQGTSGAMLLGSEEFVRDARTWQWRLGGRIYQTFPLALEAERCLNANINGMAARADKLREVARELMLAQEAFVREKNAEAVWEWMKQQERADKQRKKKAAAEAAAAASATSSKFVNQGEAAAASAAATASPPSGAQPVATPTTAAAAGGGGDGGAVSGGGSPFHPFFSFTPAVPTCAMVHMYLQCPSADAVQLRDQVAAETGAGEAASLPAAAVASSSSSPSGPILVFDRVRGETSRTCYWEWKMGTENARIPTDIFVRAWRLWMAARYQQIRNQMARQDHA